MPKIETECVLPKREGVAGSNPARGSNKAYEDTEGRTFATQH